MKRNISSKLLVAFCLLAIAGCKSKKALVATPSSSSPTATVTPTPAKPKVNLMDPVRAAQTGFNTFSGKATGKIDLNGDKHDVTLNIRITKDKKIWASVTVSLVVTVEVARAVITPDSLLMIDKVNGVYVKKPFSFLYKYTNSQINYQMLESMFVGNAQDIILNDPNASFQTDAGGTSVSGTLDDLVYKLLLNADMKPAQLNISNHNAGQSLQVTNSDFNTISGKKVPSQIDIQSSASKKNVHVMLHYTKIDWDQPLDYPFNIPASYKPAAEN